MRTERSDLVCRDLLLRGTLRCRPANDLGLGGEGTWNFPALAVAGAVAQAVSPASAAANREQRMTEAPVQGPHCPAQRRYYET